ncbi:MAG: TetR/AcrR family transcriptional regulator [Ktedonobacteraceae bacterium]
MTTLPEKVKRKAGRPRSAESHQAILQATIELLTEEGFESMSIEAIAARAGVGKTTIYRRWATKADLVIDALEILRSEVPLIDTGDLRSDLIAVLQSGWQQTPSYLEALTLKMVGELKSNPEVFKAFYARLVVPRSQQFASMIERAKARGQIRSDIAPEFVVDLVAGPILFRTLFTSLVTSTPADYPKQVVDAILDGIAAKP